MQSTSSVLQEWNETEKSRQRKNRINREKLSTFLQSSAAKTVNEKVIELENNCKSAKQVAHGYLYNWKQTKEENSRLLYSASCNFKEEDIPKSMIIKRDLLEVKGDKILGKGTLMGVAIRANIKI